MAIFSGYSTTCYIITNSSHKCLQNGFSPGFILRFSTLEKLSVTLIDMSIFKLIYLTVFSFSFLFTYVFSHFQIVYLYISSFLYLLLVVCLLSSFIIDPWHSRVCFLVYFIICACDAALTCCFFIRWPKESINLNIVRNKIGNCLTFFNYLNRWVILK